MNLPLALFILLALSGSLLAVAGTYILFGLGWSLVSASVFSFAGASFLRKGMTA
jgi:hypothetical protein